MTFPNKYIKMCREAIELRKLWKPQKGDYIYDYCYKSRGIIIGSFAEPSVEVLWLDIKGMSDFTPDSSTIPLWRQDQLEAMSGLSKDMFSAEFLDWLLTYKEKTKHTAIIELTLAFVMFRKYGKIWDNNKSKWIERKEKENLEEELRESKEKLKLITKKWNHDFR